MRNRLFRIVLVWLLCLGWLGANAALPAEGIDVKPFPTLAPMLKRVNPAVVNISTWSNTRQEVSPLLDDPFFRYFFDLPELEQPLPRKRQRSAGSGVIVDAREGIVMTNHHVIEEADEIHVGLLDGRSIKAELVGSDPELDIAILVIEAVELTAIEFADSSRLEVGDFVVAIGNPFGLGQTVTTGVVSALGRGGLGIEGYENFIQTDASINPGNSGGALVNLGGELVGINTAIISPAGGNVGIGFAIPANLARASMRQIVEHGEVRRGQIGVGIQDITPDLREAFELDRGVFGVLVTKVFEDSPAERAGIRAGDIILAVDGKSTRSSAQLRSHIGVTTVGQRVVIRLLRAGADLSLNVEIGPAAVREIITEALHPLLDGLRLDNNPEGEGVLVIDVSPNSVAAYSGLRPGDIIVGANRRRVSDIESLVRATDYDESSILLHVERAGGSLFIVIR